MYLWCMEKRLPEAIVLFDGVCNFCNTTVNTIIRHDKRAYIKFAPLQSDLGKELLHQHQIDIHKVDSVIFIERGKAYVFSSAILYISRRLNGLFPLLFVFILVPAFIRNPIYKWIARNRYKWFGKMDHCMVPTPEVRSRFIG